MMKYKIKNASANQPKCGRGIAGQFIAAMIANTKPKAKMISAISFLLVTFVLHPFEQ